MFYIVKSEIINKLSAENRSYRKCDIEFVVNAFIDVVKSALRNGEKVKIDGFGTFSPYTRTSSTGKNITATLDDIQVQKYIGFKPSKKLKN